MDRDEAAFTPAALALAQRIRASHRILTGQELGIADAPDSRTAALLLYEADRPILAHDGTEEPRFTYANLAAQRLFGRDWADLVGLPSRNSAPEEARAERSEALRQVRERGWTSGYQGERIAADGRRFRIQQAVLWNLLDEGRICGQAASIGAVDHLGHDAAVGLVQGPQGILLIRRAVRPQDPWSGHWALPGGRRDPADRHALDTARRELAEECGLDLPEAGARDLGVDLTGNGRAGSRVLRIAVQAWTLDRHPDLKPDPAEVAATHWLPLDLPWTLRHERLTPDRAWPALDLGCGPLLWGFTLRVLERWKKGLSPS